MRDLFLVLLLVCASLCGCSPQQEYVLQTGRSLNLMPTEAEKKAGDR